MGNFELEARPDVGELRNGKGSSDDTLLARLVARLFLVAGVLDWCMTCLPCRPIYRRLTLGIALSQRIRIPFPQWPSQGLSHSKQFGSIANREALIIRVLHTGQFSPKRSTVVGLLW